MRSPATVTAHERPPGRRVRHRVTARRDAARTRRNLQPANGMTAKLVAEFLGTFWLVLGGCGSAVLAAAFPGLGVGFAGVSLAFGLTVLTGAYAFGPISGGHFNPAVSVGLWAGGRFPGSQVPSYVGAQLAGAISAAGMLYVIASGAPGFDVSAGFAANGYGVHSPGGYSLLSAAVTEMVMTFMFLMVILGATDERAPAGFGGLAIGLALTLIHLVSIPVTNTSVNPARSTGPALFAGAAALSQLWLFWVMPLVGAVAAGTAWRTMMSVRAVPRIEQRWRAA
jgi:aquaporin Z